MQKLKKTRIQLLSALGIICLMAVVGVGLGVKAFSSQGTPEVVMETVNIETYNGANGIMEENIGAISGPNVYYDMVFHGTVKTREASTSLAPTSVYATTTLTVADSGTTYYLSASGTTITLPAVSTSGVNFKFVINGAADTGNFIVDSAEGDNIEGTLIVAGAVVDCASEDQINFVVDGENIGDYFEIVSDGSQWLLGDSGVLTAAKLTCTDPS